jgi:hypothetical protein
VTLILKLEPGVEAGLAVLAGAKGLPLDLYVRGLLEQLAGPAIGVEMTPEQRAGAFEQLIESLPDMPVLSDEAMGRDAMYRVDDGSPR